MQQGSEHACSATMCMHVHNATPAATARDSYMPCAKLLVKRIQHVPDWDAVLQLDLHTWRLFCAVAPVSIASSTLGYGEIVKYLGNH